ncbi:TRAP transporter small permease subunit [Aquicoccus sp. SCR17]|nr:TRAP transporter small permease subunit [Carideicomes alvinocaridis]
MRAAARRFDDFSALLSRIALWGAVLAVAGMVIIAAWQAAARYLLDQPPIWTEQLASNLMVWAGLLGASCAFRAKLDPSLFPDQQFRDGAVGLFLRFLRAFGTLVFVLPILWYCIFGLNGSVASGYIARLSGRMAESLPVSMSVFGIAIPIGFALVVIHVLADLGLAVSGAHPRERHERPTI